MTATKVIATRWPAVALTSAFVLLGSTEARAEWVPKTSPTGNALSQVQCLTTTNCWIAGFDGVVLHSTDGGEHWVEVDSGAPTNYGAWNSVSFADENTGWFAGLRIISRTADAGEQWTGAGMGPGPFDDPPFQNALWAVSTQVAWTVGADLWDVGGGDILGVPVFWIHSVDGSGEFQNYTEWAIPTLGGVFYDLEFVGTEDAWAIGYSDQPVPTGIIYRVQNASAEDPLITPQSFGQNLALEGISMIDKQQGWIVGEAGLIMGTHNGGVVWTSQPSGVVDDLWDVHFVDAANGWAVGEAGLIASTKNGGNTWQKATFSTTAHLTSVHFLSTDFGFAVGSSGTILKWEAPACGDAEECGGAGGGADLGGAGSGGANESGAGGARQAGAGGESTEAGAGGRVPESGAGGDGSQVPGGAENGAAGEGPGAGAGPGAGGTENSGEGGSPGQGGASSSDGGISAGAEAVVDPRDRVTREGGGCSCRTTSGSSSGGAAALALVAGLVMLRRRGSWRLA